MTNLTKLCAAAMIFHCTWAWAGEAIIFDRPGLTGYRENNEISGMHAMENGRFSCIFFFFEDKSVPSTIHEDGFSETKIMTFGPNEKSFLFEDRDKIFDIPGKLYDKDRHWIIKTATAQAGCETSAGVFTFDRHSLSARTYTIADEIPAIGIRLVKKKSSLYNYKNGKYVIRRDYLTKWDGVIQIKIQGNFSYVRFVDARADAKTFGRVTTGWIHSTDLVNPFPMFSKK
ncbi:hypothetical protein GCM10027093_00020 [Paraburkholderia jirisanensis]